MIDKTFTKQSQKLKNCNNCNILIKYTASKASTKK